MAEKQKYICLSFDDGPNFSGSQTMSDMLDILEKHNVPGSFFLIGNKISDENTPVIKRAFNMGCDIQNHSWTHSNMQNMSVEEIKEEYKKCDEAIIKITGKKPEFFRPPYIAISDNMYKAIEVPFICGKGCEDWVPEVDAEARYNTIINTIEDGTIILLHVLEGNEATLKAVDKAIPKLKEMGYKFVNLPDLYKKENVNPNIKESLWHVVQPGAGKRDR